MDHDHFDAMVHTVGTGAFWSHTTYSDGATAGIQGHYTREGHLTRA